MWPTFWNSGHQGHIPPGPHLSHLIEESSGGVSHRVSNVGLHLLLYVDRSLCGSNQWAKECFLVFSLVLLWIQSKNAGLIFTDAKTDWFNSRNTPRYKTALEQTTVCVFVLVEPPSPPQYIARHAQILALKQLGSNLAVTILFVFLCAEAPVNRHWNLASVVFSAAGVCSGNEQ